MCSQTYSRFRNSYSIHCVLTVFTANLLPIFIPGVQDAVNHVFCTTIIRQISPHKIPSLMRKLAPGSRFYGVLQNILLAKTRQV